ncbi:MAG: hypothetical protein ACYDHY_16030 [Acidiferrobacterales bacterium]
MQTQKKIRLDQAPGQTQEVTDDELYALIDMRENALGFTDGRMNVPSMPVTRGNVRKLRAYLLDTMLRMAIDGRGNEYSRLEAIAWIDNRAVYPFSFETCCIEMGYDPDKMRDSFHRLRMGIKEIESRPDWDWIIRNIMRDESSEEGDLSTIH